MFGKALTFGVAFLVWFAIRADRRQRTAVLLGWLIPGAGQFYLGEKARGLFLGFLVIGVFFAGMVIADFRNISPFERHPIWGIAHLFGGIMTGIAAFATKGLMIVRDNPLYTVGCLYSGVGALMNVLVMIDAYDLASKKPVLAPEDAPAEEVAA
ncbi:MAG: TM2 domain-containing membrane protein YozV [Planctomycetota bacterium]|jgi:TM2 domain-containing membrane protein YozV